VPAEVIQVRAESDRLEIAAEDVVNGILAGLHPVDVFTQRHDRVVFGFGRREAQQLRQIRARIRIE